MVSSTPFQQAENVDAEDQYVRDLVSWVWGRYGHLSSFALSNMTHKHGTPWHRVATENDFRINYNTEIPDQYIFEEFTRLINIAVVSQGNEDEVNAEQQQTA